MKYLQHVAILAVLLASVTARAQTPGAIYTWSDLTNQDWFAWGKEFLGAIYPTGSWNSATISGATGDLVVNEKANGTNGDIGGSLWIMEGFTRPRENWGGVQGNLDVTGLQYIELDIRHSSLSETIPVDFLLVAYQNNQPTTLASGPTWSVGPGVNTLRFPLNLLSPRLQGNIQNFAIVPGVHTSVGNVTWTISEMRSVGTPLTYRDIVTNDAGTPDDGIDGAFPLSASDMQAIVGNDGTVSQLGFSRNASGSGSLQWTDKGGTGSSGSPSGASIGWGNGSGWRNAIPGVPTSGNSYNERMSDFSNYDRMTVRISALDSLNPSGTVAIAAPFLQSDIAPPVVLASQNLTTNGQYYELVYDLSTVPFLKTLQHWGLDVAPHPNNIVFNIDNIRLWTIPEPSTGTLVFAAAVLLVPRKRAA